MNMMDLVGQTIGQYRIDAPLGSGGMGQVYRGVHQLLDRPAAIKVMQAHLVANPEFRSRFLREAKSAAALRHPNIVEIYEFGEQEGLLYLVMELVTDGSLRTLLRRVAGRPLPLAFGLDLMRQAARGLAAAHTLHMVHRDIKPDNLLVSRQDDVTQAGEQYVLKIGDFGLARLAESSGLTATGVPMGTLAYMSPEQCQSKQLDGRSDLYSLGVVLYEVTTGYLPFQIDNFVDALNKHINVPPPSPRELRPDLSPILEKIILRCLAKKPEDRYATAADLVSALQGGLGTVGSQTTASSRPSPGSPVQPGETVLQPPGTGGMPAPVVSGLPGRSRVPRVRVLDQHRQALHVVVVTSRGLIIGREPGNDIVLPSDAVSRQHLQVLWDGKQVSVKDLGSSNGTLLGEVRLLPQVSQPWAEQQLIRIGPFWLRLEGASQADAPTQATQPSAFTPSRAPRPQVLSERISISVTPKTLTITPGQPATVKVTLTNLGSAVDWLTTTVEGVTPEWVQLPGEAVQLNPGMQETVDLSVNVARSANNRAQDYPVTIRARSRAQPNESATDQTRWTVLSFMEDAVKREPQRTSGHAKAADAMSQQNNANTPAHDELSGEDDEQKMASHMAHVSPEAQRLIARDRLGTPTKIYKPRTTSSIITGLFVLVFSIVWELLAVVIAYVIAAATKSIFAIFGLALPLIGLIVFGAGLRIVFRAIRNRHIRVVVCTHGVAYVMRNSADAFRWEQVLTIFHGVSVSTSTTSSQSGGTSTSTSIEHTYTVHCQDGRKFVFDSRTLGKVQELAEAIEVEVARRRR